RAPSATVTAHATAEAPVFTVRFAGALKTGFSWSSTVTVCVAVFVLPCASVAVQVIVVVPTGNNAANNAASLRTPTSVTPGQVSEAVVPSDAIVAPQAPAVETVRFEVAIVGFSVSFTVTVKFVLALPHALVAVAVTVVTPTGKT